jgi:hypothetical protein
VTTEAGDRDDLTSSSLFKCWPNVHEDNAAWASWSSENQAKLQASCNQVLIEHQPVFRSNGLALRQGSLPRGRNECQFPPVIVNDDPSVDWD